MEIFIIDKVFDKFNKEDIMQMKEVMKNLYTACKQDDVYLVENLYIIPYRLIVKKYKDKHLHELWESTANRIMFRYARHRNLMGSYDEHNSVLQALENRNKL